MGTASCALSLIVKLSRLETVKQWKVNELSSKTQEKFKKWAEKVRLTLSADDESALDALPTEIQWLQYWTEKLRHEEPRVYAKIEKTEIKLKSESARRLNSNYLGFLKKAQKHKKGTKVRINDVLRYAYHYSNYVHPSFIAGRREDQAKKTLESFWESYLKEIVRYRNLLEDYQIEWILRLVGQSRDVGLKIDDRQISKLRARLSKLEFLFTFFNVKKLVQMANELSHQQVKWKFKRRPRMSLVKSIVRNVTVEEIEGYIRNKILHKEIPCIQANKSGWILGPLGLSKSTVTRKLTMTEDIAKFLLRHLNYPTPYLEIQKKVGDKPSLTIDKHDRLLKEKTCQLLLTKLTDKQIFGVFNQLINEGTVKITSIERYWNFVTTPFGVFEPPYFGAENLANIILKTFREHELGPHVEGTGLIEDMIRQKCIVEPPDEILMEFFGSGPYLTKLARKIGLIGLDKIDNKKIFMQSILIKLGFDVSQELQSIVSLTSKLEGRLKQVKSGSTLAEGEWNAIYSSLEQILEDLMLFYGSIWHEQKLIGLEEEKWEIEIKSWIRKTFKLKKQFDYLTLGDLCVLLRDMNLFSRTDKRVLRLMNKLFRRTDIIKEKHLQELDFIKGCRTELTKIHRRLDIKKCDQREVLERLTGLLRDCISEKGLSKTYPYAIRLKEEITTEFGIRYYKVVNEEGRVLKLKTNKLIMPEERWFMISRNDIFPIDPVLVRKYW